MVSDPLRLLQICTTSDGAAAVVLTSWSMRSARGRDGSGEGGGRIDGDADLSRRRPSRCRTCPPTRRRRSRLPERLFRDAIAHAALEEAGIGPEDLSLAEVYDLSTALELDWYENIGLCKEGEAARLLHDGDTTLGGRVPVNPSGGLGVLRRGGPRAGDRAGVRGHVAATRAGGRPTGGECKGGTDDQSGAVRTRLLRDLCEVSDG